MNSQCAWAWNFSTKHDREVSHDHCLLERFKLFVTNSRYIYCKFDGVEGWEVGQDAWWISQKQFILQILLNSIYSCLITRFFLLFISVNHTCKNYWVMWTSCYLTDLVRKGCDLKQRRILACWYMKKVCGGGWGCYTLSPAPPSLQSCL